MGFGCALQSNPMFLFLKLVIYIYAYIIYNISMKVNYEPKHAEKLRKMLRDKDGIVLASDLSKQGIPRTYLSLLEKKGEIQRVSRGVYTAGDVLIDEMAELQSRYKGAVFSHETALYLHDLTDRSPLFYSVTVPSGYNATPLKESGARVFFIKRDLYPLGLTSISSPQGNELRTYNLERTICDVVRSRNQMDVQLVTEALKRYASKKEKNIDLLVQYAAQFRVEKIIRTYLEVLL